MTKVKVRAISKEANKELLLQYRKLIVEYGRGLQQQNALAVAGDTAASSDLSRLLNRKFAKIDDLQQQILNAMNGKVE